MEYLGLGGFSSSLKYKSITLYFKGVWVFFAKNLKKEKNLFYSLHLVFSYYYCSIDLKKQSEHSGLCPDASDLVYINCFNSIFLNNFSKVVPRPLNNLLQCLNRVIYKFFDTI